MDANAGEEERLVASQHPAFDAHLWPDGDVDDLDGPGLLSAVLTADDATPPLDPGTAVRLVESTTVGVIVLSAVGVATYVNPAASRLLGWERDELIGADVFHMLHPHTDHGCPITDTAADGVTRTEAPDVFTTRTGALPVLCTVDPLVVDGVVTRVVLSFTDATLHMLHLLDERSAAVARQEALDHLAQVNQQKTDFVYTVSHELRTPLTAVLGYLELATEDPQLSDDTKDYLQVADRNARRLLAHVEALLSVSRIESGKTATAGAWTSHNLLDIASNAAAALRSLSDNKNLTVTVRAAGQPPHAVCEPFQIEQVITNLISNAIKFTPRDGSIDVRIAGYPTYLHVEVEDTGGGIPAAELPHVFDKFYRSTRAQTDATPGTGLGLAITKAIVNDHGGQVSVASEEGRGTVVGFTLPTNQVTITR